MAGVSRLQYAPEIKLIRVMCSGRVDLEFVLKAFRNGLDGVFIGGCRLNECNYITHGNYHALTMVLLCKKIMKNIGLNPERLQIELMSSADGALLAEKINAFTDKIKKLGPGSEQIKSDGENLIKKLDKVIALIPYIKIAKREKLDIRLEDKSGYESLFTDEEIDQLINNAPSYYIDPEKCRACMVCAKRCPVDAIDGGKNIIHLIDQDRCIKCGTCMEVCPSKFSAVIKLTNETPPPPLTENERVID